MKEDVLFAEVARVRRKRIESGQFEQRRREEAAARRAAAEDAVRAADGEDGREYGAPAAGDGAYGQDNAGSFGGDAASAGSVNPIPLLDPVERDLIYYLLKFGEYILTFDGSKTYGAEAPVIRITVAEYISAQLQDDGLVLQNPLYRRMFQMYFSFRGQLLEEDSSEAGRDPEVLQGRILRQFVNCQDPQVSVAVVDITEAKYVINVKEYLKSQIPERNTIDINVPKAVKLKYVEHACSLLMAELGRLQSGSVRDAALSAPGQEEQSSAEPAESGLQKTMRELKALLQAKNMIVRELNRIS